jgi:hypothetical protein
MGNSLASGGKMMRFSSIFTMAVLLILSPFPAQADSPVIVLSGNYDRPVAVRYKMRADHIAQTVTITSSEKGFSAKLKGIRDGERYLIEQVEEKGQIVAYSEPAYLHPGSEGVFKVSYGGSEPRTQVQLLLPVVSGADDIFSGGIEIGEFISTLHPPGKTKFQTSAVRLAVEDPEKSRGKVLEMIGAQLRSTKEWMKGSGKVIISGLEGPIKVNQVDDINVELFIDYRVSLEIQ